MRSFLGLLLLAAVTSVTFADDLVQDNQKNGIKIDPNLVYYAGDRDPNASAAYFFDKTPNYVFSMSTIKENGDILVHMSAPGSAEWYGVGFGTSMMDAFMFISYPTANGSVITTSPRRSTGHYEPEYDPKVDLVKVWGDTYGPNSNLHNPKGISISHFLCRNCTRYIKNFSYTDSKLPCFYAIGQKGNFGSDDMGASLSKHVYHGHFTMDMNHATSHDFNYGRVPAPNGDDQEHIHDGTTFTTLYAEGPFDVGTNDREYWPIVHAVLMLLAFVIIFPLGALSVRIFQSVMIHLVTQTLGLILVIVGFIAGYFVSMEYIKSRKFDSTHQRMGFVIFGLVFLQSILGTVHHLIYKSNLRKASTVSSISISKRSRPSMRIPFKWVHAILGPLVLVLALVNGGLGFNFADNEDMIIPYAVVVGILFAAFVGVRIWTGLYHMPQQYVPDPDMLEQYMKSPVYNSFSGASDKQSHITTREIATPEETIPMTPKPYARGPAPYTPSTSQRPRAPWERADSLASESPYSAASMKTPWSVLHDAPQTGRNNSMPREPSIAEEEEEAREQVHSHTGLSHYASTEQMIPSLQSRRQQANPAAHAGLSLTMKNRI